MDTNSEISTAVHGEVSRFSRREGVFLVNWLGCRVKGTVPLASIVSHAIGRCLLVGLLLLAIGAFADCSVAGATSTDSCVTLCCSETNDLYRVLKDNDIAAARCNSPAEAVDAAPNGSGVLILADGYPTQTTEVAGDVLAEAAKKELRLYVEFPSKVGSREFGPARAFLRSPYRSILERAVIVSDFFGKELPGMEILAIHGGHLVESPSVKSHIVAARVAGCHRAVFGLPSETHPLLLELDDDTMVSTTKLSQFVTARYAPHKAFQTIWQKILGWVSRDKLSPWLVWQPRVRPMYGKDGALPKDVERQALRRAADWYLKSGALVTAQDDRDFRARNQQGTYPMPEGGLPLGGDGHCGVIENIASAIDHNGNQEFRVNRRSDSVAETAMVMALAWKVLGEEKYREVSANLLDYIYFLSDYQQGPMADPTHPAFGLTSWSVPASTPKPGATNKDFCYLGGDCRQALACLAAPTLLEDDRWDQHHLRYMLAVERVTGANGFWALYPTTRELESRGWRWYSNRNANPRPADMPAAPFLMAYQVTGHKPFLVKAKRNLTTTMTDLYPDKFRRMNTLNSTNCLLVWALAWLVQTEDTPQHREWLYRVTGDLLYTQEPCGAIREFLGEPGRGVVTTYGPPKSNAEYGMGESVLMQENGDPMTDSLYCNGFTLVALHEAYAATGDPYFKKAEDAQAEFLCRSQIRSEEFPWLDGAWFRSFDFNAWEYWGNSCDPHYGSWCVETGWGFGYAMVGLAVRQLETSLWDLCKQSRIKDKLPVVREEMSQNNGEPWTGG